MDLRETRQIPMWAASPLLPVGAGLLLFGFLGALTFAERRVDPPNDVVAPVHTGRLAPANRTAGELKGPKPIANSPLPAAEREVRRLGRQGDYLGALEVYRALPPEIRAAFKADLERKEQNLLESAAAHLLDDLQRDKLDRIHAIERLKTLLTLEGAEGLAKRGDLEAALKGLQTEDEPGRDRTRAPP